MESSQNIIICVGRQLGAGGRDIGRMLAEQFEAKYYDRELLNLAAKESGFSERFFEQNDEKKGFFRSLLNLQGTHLGSNGLYRSDISQESLFQFQSDAIRKAAEQGSCVFLGRCADYVLRDYPRLAAVFITAPLEFRVRQLMEKEGIEHAAALKRIEQGESQRAAYYNYYTGKRWGQASSYDLCIDSSLLGIRQTGAFITEFIRKKFSI